MGWETAAKAKIAKQKVAKATRQRKAVAAVNKKAKPARSAASQRKALDAVNGKKQSKSVAEIQASRYGYGAGSGAGNVSVAAARKKNAAAAAKKKQVASNASRSAANYAAAGKAAQKKQYDTETKARAAQEAKRAALHKSQGTKVPKIPKSQAARIEKNRAAVSNNLANTGKAQSKKNYQSTSSSYSSMMAAGIVPKAKKK